MRLLRLLRRTGSTPTAPSLPASAKGARLLAVGIAAGLLAAFAVSRLLGTLVFGISATDPLTFIGVPLVLAAVALVANLVPARRATSLDPADALRAD